MPAKIDAKRTDGIAGREIGIENVQRPTSNAQPPSQRLRDRSTIVSHEIAFAAKGANTDEIVLAKIDIINDHGRRLAKDRCRRSR